MSDEAVCFACLQALPHSPYSSCSMARPALQEAASDPTTNLGSGSSSLGVPASSEGPPPPTHELKVWPEYYRDIESSLKTFEYRKDDREPRYAVGDVLRLREWTVDTSSVGAVAAGRSAYTGRECFRRVAYVARDGPIIPEGYCIMAIEPVLASRPPSPASPTTGVALPGKSALYPCCKHDRDAGGRLEGMAYHRGNPLSGSKLFRIAGWSFLASLAVLFLVTILGWVAVGQGGALTLAIVAVLLFCLGLAAVFEAARSDAPSSVALVSLEVFAGASALIESAVGPISRAASDNRDDALYYRCKFEEAGARIATLEAENGALQEAVKIGLGFIVIPEDAEVRPQSMSVVTPSELVQRVTSADRYSSSRIAQLEQQAAAYESAQREIEALPRMAFEVSLIGETPRVVRHFSADAVLSILHRATTNENA